MNILIVTQHFLNGNGGGVFASRAFINAIAEIGDKVTLLYPFKKGCEIEKINLRVNAIPVPNEHNNIVKLWNLIRGRIHRYFGVFEKTLKADKYDIVVFDNSRVSYRMIDTARRYVPKVITIHHNCELEYVGDNAVGVIGKILLFWTKYQERDAVLKSDINLTLTQQDVELLANHYNAGKKDKFKVIGCFEYEHREPVLLTKTFSDNLRLVITGNLSAYQTEQSLIPWLDLYYPILKDIIPDCSLTIAGKSPSKKITDRCLQLGINLIPSPTDMQPILSETDVYICPTALGGGLKLRIMDGLKNGIPVLTHDISARGYDAFRQKGFLFTYSDPQSFRESLQSILIANVSNVEVINAYQNIFSFEAGVKRMKEYIL